MLETYIREVDKVMYLTINGELITTTVNHPFYVKGHGFVVASELFIGDKLLDTDGNILLVESITIELTEEPTKVYNFQVEDFHTYYVGENEIWVHNKCDVDAGKPGSLEWDKAKDIIKNGRKHGNNVEVETEAQARQLLNESGRNLTEYPARQTPNEAKAGFEVHPEDIAEFPKPHIKWKDWSGGKSNGADGHIFFKGE